MTQIAVSRQVKMIIEASGINTTGWKYQLDLWKDDGKSRVLFIRGTGGGSNSIYVEGQPIEVMAIGGNKDSVAKPMELIQQIKSALIAYPKETVKYVLPMDINGSPLDLNGSPLTYNANRANDLAINVPIYHFDLMGGIMTTQTKDGRPMCILNAIAETDRNEVF
tara:strand:- start:1162 stop:1656 length:495 start_codon:yes stop_codon:yes gene_type:complete